MSGAGRVGELVGQLIGENTIVIDRSHNYADVTGVKDEDHHPEKIGGLVGQPGNGTVFQSSNRGTVSQGGFSDGGHRGPHFRGGIRHPRQHGRRHGAILAQNFGDEPRIKNTYNIGEVTPDGLTKGGFIGKVESDANATVTIDLSYYNTEVVGGDGSAAGEGKTETEMKDPNTYVGWDFDTVWDIDADD